MKMNSVVLVLLVLSLLGSGSVSAKDSRDLPAGIAYPSNNSAIFDNPAAFGHLEGSALEAGYGLNPRLIRASYSRAQGGKGFGLGFTQDSADRSTGTLAGGWKLGPVELGLDGNYRFSDQDLSVDFGLRSELGSKAVFALTVPDVLSFNNRYTLGFGADVGNSILLEADFDFQHGSDMTQLNRIDGTALILVNNPQNISLLAGLPFDVYPTPKFSLDRPRFGLSFWLSPSFGIYGLYHPVESDYIVSIKIQ